jgi:hypothetical protein
MIVGRQIPFFIRQITRQMRRQITRQIRQMSYLHSKGGVTMRMGDY